MAKLKTADGKPVPAPGESVNEDRKALSEILRQIPEPATKFDVVDDPDAGTTFEVTLRRRFNVKDHGDIFELIAGADTRDIMSLIRLGTVVVESWTRDSDPSDPESWTDLDPMTIFAIHQRAGAWTAYRYQAYPKN